jgi:SNF2 family DNA or RNA helicase
MLDYPFKTKPFDHQLKELKESWDKPVRALFWEMGTGKSKVLLDTIGMLYLAGKIDSAVLVAKKGEYANLVYTQIPTHLPDEIEREVLLYSTYQMNLTRGQKALERFLDPAKKRLRIFVVNIEAMTSAGVKKALAQLYKTSKAVFFGLDESTCAKNMKAARSKEVYLWASKSHYRRIMTGSPVTNSPEDLWGQSLVLGRGLFGTTSFYSFRDTYLEREPQTIYRAGRPTQIMVNVGTRNLDRLVKYLDLFSSRLTKHDCLDLPDKIYTKLAVELTSEQERLYAQLRDQALVELEGEQLEVTHALTLITKLHQIACGQLKFEDGSYASIPNNRLQALEDLLEDFPGKAIIWASYRQTLEDILKRLGEVYGPEAVLSYYGGTSEEDRRRALAEFQDPGSKARFFVGNPQSGGYGLTLTQATLVVYYSNSYNLEHRLQSEDRAHRLGQTEKVTYVDLYCPDTVDERIMEVLRGKKNLADVIMRQPIREWL